jgi:hypothetical protein
MALPQYTGIWQIIEPNGQEEFFNNLVEAALFLYDHMLWVLFHRYNLLQGYFKPMTAKVKKRLFTN